jgi:cytochrome c-type biogenesis protein CcsB
MNQSISHAARTRLARRSIASIAFVMLAIVVPMARAQTAPAGNAHPAAEVLSAGMESMQNPFGPPVLVGQGARPSANEDALQKHAFAEALDKAGALEPLALIPVLHDGRVKILDTLARESVLKITGRRDFFDVGSQDGKPASKLHYAPMFTWLDLMIDPVFYADRPLIFVDYLPLRDKYLETAYPQDEAARTRMRTLQRIPMMAAARYFAPLRDAYDTDANYARGLQQVSMSLSLAQQGVANLLLLAPAQEDQPYRHVSTLAPDSPLRRAMLALGAAWRARDAASVKQSVESLRKELDALPGARPSSARVTLESIYNRAHAFEWGYWMYFLALVSLILAFGTGRKWLIATGVTTLALAVALHAGGFAARCIIADRFAIQNQYESMTGLSLFGAIVGLSIMLLKRQWLFGAAAAGVGFIVLITATQTAIPGKSIEREAAILNTSILLKYHVTTVLSSYGLITLGMICSLFYLGTYYAAKLRGRLASPLAGASLAGAGGAIASDPPRMLAASALNIEEGAPTGVQRTLSDLDKAQMTVLQLAFWALGVGILLGAWWADHSWGRWWAFDPKETWALITWIVYLIAIHTRFTGVRNKGLVTAWLSVVGFIVMVWCYFGVNLLLPGLHAYA